MLWLSGSDGASAVPKTCVTGRSEDVIFFGGVFFLVARVPGG